MPGGALCSTHVAGRLRAVRFLFRPLGHLRSWTTCVVICHKASMSSSTDRQAELIGSCHTTAMMYLEQRVRQGDDNPRQLDGLRESERRNRENAGRPLPVDIRYRLGNARRWRLLRPIPQARHRRAPVTRRRAARGRSRSRSGRGSPPGDSDPDGDGSSSHIVSTAGGGNA